jgi:sulfate transport system substrate-binding protein
MQFVRWAKAGMRDSPRETLLVVLLLCGTIGLLFTVITWSKDACVRPLPGEPITLIHVAPMLTTFHYEYNALFERTWKCMTGQTVTIKQSYGASGDQMRAILRGDIVPDIISMSNPSEMDTIAEETSIVSAAWRDEFPFGSSPYYTTLVFVVREGNPKEIRDWEDLTKPGLTINVSDPKTCGGGRWVYTAALGHGMEDGRAAQESEEFLTRFYANVPVLYPNQGVAADAFFDRHSGDVLVTYETTVLHELRGHARPEDVEMVVPSRTVRVDRPIAYAPLNTELNGTTEIAKAYIRGLYEPDAQRIVARHLLRPRDENATKDLLARFPATTFHTRADVFSDSTAEHTHLGDGGFFDVIRGQ